MSNLPPRDLYRDIEPDDTPSIQDEIERTISDIAMGNAPTNVMGVLLENREHSMAGAAIAARIGKTSFEITGTLAIMEANGWLVRFEENGHEKYIIRGAVRD